MPLRGRSLADVIEEGFEIFAGQSCGVELLLHPTEHLDAYLSIRQSPGLLDVALSKEIVFEPFALTGVPRNGIVVEGLQQRLSVPAHLDSPLVNAVDEVVAYRFTGLEHLAIDRLPAPDAPELLPDLQSARLGRELCDRGLVVAREVDGTLAHQ